MNAPAKTAVVLSTLFISFSFSAPALAVTTISDDIGENWSLIGSIGKITLWPAILFFTTALITYPLKQNVFEAWKKFAVWAVPVVLIFTYLITNNDSGGGFFTMDFSIYFLAIVYSLFFLISLTIIGVSAFRSRNKS